MCNSSNATVMRNRFRFDHDSPGRDVVLIELRTLTPGESVKFHPNPGNRWWTVQAVSDRFVIATRKAAFPTDDNGGLMYTVVSLTPREYTYNNVPAGTIGRSSVNLIGGGYTIDPDNPQPDCETMLSELTSGELELSDRRVVPVFGVVSRPTT